ncbi:hypothetical protein Pmani_012470 [Petrolisthes manimaculis]|uniref:Uncharacterized protein n=1 Tax=Petrolisthes manimaculis TaxID=1843537 RepID=A0AAE1UEL0_9EUCA|nr:hypothetical protein Pmani_012470 [Petrolisthes manimaculis]
MTKSRQALESDQAGSSGGGSLAEEQTQSAIERSHQTLKGISRKYALQFQSKWDEDLSYLLFVLRDSPNESTGFSPYELVFAHQV